MNGITRKTLNATLNGEQVIVALGTYICMYNDFVDGSSWGGSQKVAESKVERLTNSFRSNPSKPHYFLAYGDTHVTAENNGKRVFKVPEDFKGTYSEWDLDDVEVVGTFLKGNNRWTVETDHEVVEHARRENEYALMDKDRMSVGFSKNTEDNRSSQAYRKHLAEKDKTYGGMLTRDHGIDDTIIINLLNRDTLKTA
jgi:hypothetical protein